MSYFFKNFLMWNFKQLFAFQFYNILVSFLLDIKIIMKNNNSKVILF